VNRARTRRRLQQWNRYADRCERLTGMLAVGYGRAYPKSVLAGRLVRADWHAEALRVRRGFPAKVIWFDETVSWEQW